MTRFPAMIGRALGVTRELAGKSHHLLRIIRENGGHGDLPGQLEALRRRLDDVTERLGRLEAQPAEVVHGRCFVCGAYTRFDSWAPVETDCKRNVFSCRSCGSVARNRHLARTILELFPTNPCSRSLAEFARRTAVRILHTCASGAIHETLRHAAGYTVTEYYDGVASGRVVNGVECQNLEQTTFADESFDLVITEDVLEHVADPERACRELRRILKPGGAHVSTIAVLWDQPTSIARATLRHGVVEHLLPPVYHGDPNRPEGALVYVDFGADIVDRYLSLTGPTEVLWSCRVDEDERRFGIFDNMVFVSRRG